MNFTFNLGELLGLGAAVLYVGASLESLRRLTASSISQGKRLGILEDWMASSKAVDIERERVRARTAAQGIVTGSTE